MMSKNAVKQLIPKINFTVSQDLTAMTGSKHFNIYVSLLDVAEAQLNISVTFEVLSSYYAGLDVQGMMDCIKNVLIKLDLTEDIVQSAVISIENKNTDSGYTSMADFM